MDSEGYGNILDKGAYKRKIFPHLSHKVHDLNGATEELLSAFIVNNPDPHKITMLLDKVKSLTHDIENDVHKIY